MGNRERPYQGLAGSHSPGNWGGGVSSDSLKIKQAKEKKALAGDSVVAAVLKLSSAHVDGWD